MKNCLELTNLREKMENEEDYMSYVESVSLRPYKEEAWPCTCKNCEMDREKLEQYNRGVIVIKEDSDVVEDFIS